MTDWYELVNTLDTEVLPLEKTAQQRVESKIRGRVRAGAGRKLRIAVLAAAVLLLTACGAAVATGQFSHWFWNMAREEQDEALFEALGTVIGESQRVGDITMTLDGALWDGEELFLTLSVEGMEFETDYGTDVETERSWLGASKESVWAQAGETMKHEEFERLWEASLPLKSPEISYIYNRREDSYRLQVYSALRGSVGSAAELTLHLEDLQVRNKSIEGPFEFTFSLIPGDVTLRYTGAVSVAPEGLPELCVSEIRVSPFGVELDFTTEEERSLEDIEITLLQIGEEEASVSGQQRLTTQQEEDGSAVCSLGAGPFREIIDPAAVTAVSINGTWLSTSEFQEEP
ncbi:MAG: DUF4179 domain-containing protein [Oscillibacter sp.]|nr:DUF4179 domain-containing protein [Oscillibacter sp.]